MRKKSLVLSMIMAILMIGLSNSSFCQSSDKDYADIYIYREKQSMMSGATGLQAKISLNGKEIGTLLNGTMMKYKLYSQGPIKMKCVAEFGGSGIGSPYIEKIDFENGKEYHIKLSLSSMKGVSGEILNEKQIKKIKKVKFSDEIELEEDKSNLICN